MVKKPMAFTKAIDSVKSYLGVSHAYPDGFCKASEGQLFPKVDPNVDGEDCDHDCATCEIRLPKGFKIDGDDKIYGHVNGWATHMIVATGKTDWVKDITNEKGSVMEAVKDVEPANGKLMLSASNMCLLAGEGYESLEERPTTVLILPEFTFYDNVTPSNAKDFLQSVVSAAATNETRLDRGFDSTDRPKSLDHPQERPTNEQTKIDPRLPSLASFSPRHCVHRYLILMCSQRTRDARCGQSAPLLKREFERHLRPLGLYRDLQDVRPGGVGIYFISHVGGHKYSANVMVYRRAECDGVPGQASQCIWLARVRPEDCEGIVKFTVLQGKVMKPERQLRGGFDRERGLVSW